MMMLKLCGLPSGVFSRKRKRMIFLKISSMPLPKLMEDILKKIPSPEQVHDWKINSQQYIDPIQTELRERLQTPLEILSSGSSVERFGISQDNKKQEAYGVLLCNWIKRVYCFCYPWGVSYSSLMTDHDVMLIPRDMTVSFEHAKSTFCAMTSKESAPSQSIPVGFAHVFSNSYDMPSRFRELCVDHDGNMCLSNRLVKNVMFSVIDNMPEDIFPSECADSFVDFTHPAAIDVYIRGPSIGCKIYPLCQVCVWHENQEIVRFEGDFIFSLRCLEWPHCADKWITRNRFWPNHYVIQKIVNKRCLLVPRPSDNHPNSELEWRISFSEAEVILSKYIPDSARRVFLALKIIYKDHLKFVYPGLKTYHLKTLFYWEMEKHSLSYWNEEDCDEMFLTLLTKLQCCIAENYLSHYWIDGVNLFENFDKKSCKDLCTLLSKVIEKPEPYVFDIASSWC